MVLKKAVQVALDPKLFPLVLYKRILRLHYGLPAAVRPMGNEYVKAEFRAHRDAPPDRLDAFFSEWLNYCRLLGDQLSHKGIVAGVVGKDLSAEAIENFADEQLRQLYDLKLESEALRKV